MVTLGYYGNLDDPAKEKIQQALNLLNITMDDANSEIQKIILHDQNLLKMKDEFISNVNHELRTPLTSIIGTTDYIIDTIHKLSETDILKRVKRIKTSSMDLLHLVNELLDFSKFEAGKLSCNLCNFNIQQILEKIKDTFEGFCKAKKINLHVDIQNFSIEHDPDHIYKILVNLVSNAYKFTESGEIRIETIKSSDFCQISVKDTGCGIHENDLENIFQRFNQGKIQNNKANGTGIGLHYANNLAQKHGGKISVESKLNHGSCFTLTLPIISQFKLQQKEVNQNGIKT